METVKIAILDDMVVKEDLINLSQETELNFIDVIPRDEHKKLTHGTICTDLILKDIGQKEIYCICVKSSEKNGNINDILTAFELCLKLKVNIISMSIGSTSFNDKAVFEKYVNIFHRMNIMLVAAHSNDLKNSYPASLDGVIGVRHTPKAINGNPYIYYSKYENVQIGMNSSLIYDKKKKIVLRPSNSFSTALATNYIVKNIYYIGMNYYDLRRKIIQLSRE